MRIRELPRYMRILTCGQWNYFRNGSPLCPSFYALQGVTDYICNSNFSRISQRVSPGAQGFTPCKAWRIPFATPTFGERFSLHVVRIDVMNAFQFSGNIELRFFQQADAAFPFVEKLKTLLTISLAIINRPLMLLDFLSSATRTTCIHLEVFQCCELSEIGPWLRQFPATINVPMFVNTAFQQNMQYRVPPPDNVNILEWYWE